MCMCVCVCVCVCVGDEEAEDETRGRQHHDHDPTCHDPTCLSPLLRPQTERDTHTDTDRYRQRQRSHATPVNPTPTVQAEQTEKEKTYCAICCAFSCAHLKGKEPADNKGEGGAITVETPPGEEGESLPSNISRATPGNAALGLIRGLVDKLFNSTGTGQ